MINRDFRELFAAFVAHDVRFLVVGGYAVAFHGHPRFTKDVDLLIARDPENARRAYAALAAFAAYGAPLDALDVDDLRDPESVFQIGVPPNRIDLLTELTGVDFEAAWQTRVPARYGDVDIAYIGLQALLQRKRASARPQDLLDAEELERRNARPPG